MSKKPQASRHRVPAVAYMRSDPVTPEYQAEVDRSTAKLEKQFRDAQKRVEATQRRRDRVARLLEREAANRKAKRQLRDLEAELHARESELAKIRALMMPDTYTGSRHRPVPRQSPAM